MTTEHEQNNRAPDNDENYSQLPELKQGEVIVENFRRHSMALLSTLQALAQMGDDLAENMDEADIATGLEETRSISAEDHIERLKADLEAPTLIERIRARIQKYEQSKMNVVLRQFGQDHHTSIN